MKFSPSVFILFLSFLAALNAAVYMGPFFHVWPAHYNLYFFWGETVLIGGFGLLLYAKHLLIFCLLLLLTGYLVGVNHVFELTGDYKMPIAFWGFYSLFWLAYFEMRRSLAGQRIKLLHPIYQFLLYLSFMFAAVAGSLMLTGYVFLGQIYIPSLPPEMTERLGLMIIVIPTITISILKIIDMIGERHVLHFLLGTYHRPVERKKIVLFLDMASSTAMAEKLPAKKSMEMIARFIFDASAAFRMKGGDILQYTGDGLVVLWPLEKADRVIEAIDMLDARLAASAPRYEKLFGALPAYRAGMHAGTVVIGQIGEEKLFLGLYGDVVNTAARIEQMNKELGTRILFSKAFKQQLSPDLKKRIKSAGTELIRGTERELEVFTLV